MSDIKLRELERQAILDPSLKEKLFRTQITYRAKPPLELKLKLSRLLLNSTMSTIAVMWQIDESYGGPLGIMAKNTAGQNLKFFNMTQEIITTKVDLNDPEIPHQNGKTTLVIAGIGTNLAQYTQSQHSIDLYDSNTSLEVFINPVLERNYQDP